jgi:ankyrin repeat protein
MRVFNLTTLLTAFMLITISCNNRADNRRVAVGDIQTEITVYQDQIIGSNETDDYDDFIKTVGLYSFTELGWACYNGNLDAVKELIEAGACMSFCMADPTFEYDVLYTSVKFNQISLLEYFISIKENGNKVYDENGMTLLSLACMSDNPDIAFEMAKLLLDAGANINGEGDMGFDYIIFPLFEATKRDNLKLAKLLVEREADITVIDKQGRTIFALVDEIDVSVEMTSYINSLRDKLQNDEYE